MASLPGQKSAGAVAQGGGSLTNAVAFTVTGSGFGTKSGSTQTLYDDCSAATLQATGWTNARSFYTITSIQSEPWGEQYRLPTATTPNADTWGATAGCIVNPATPFRSKYICSATMSANVGGYGAANIMFGYTQSTFTPPAYVVCSWYECYSPNWGFGSAYGYHGQGDNNFKWINFTNNLNTPYGTIYWYMEDGNSEFTSATATPTYDINDDSGGTTGRLPGGGEYHGPNMPNKNYNGCNGWTKKEFMMRVTDDSTGWIQVYTSVPSVGARTNMYLWNSSNGSGITDGTFTGTGRGFYLGGFRRNFPQARNRQYWSDIYLDMQSSGVGRFALTDTNSLSTATVIEYQPYTAWSNTSVTLTCQKGNLPSGTVYLWYLDEVNGNQGPTAYTMN